MATSNIRLSTADHISLLSNLSTLLASGVPILEAVASLSEDTKGNLKKILEALMEDLKQGKQVSDSFAAFPESFDKVTVNLIKAAEGAGTLDETLKDLRDYTQKEAEFIDKIIFALIYPGIILVLFASVLLVILIVVIPKIATVFLRLKVPLPLPTRIMIFMSTALLENTVWVVGGLLLITVAVILLYRKNRHLVLEVVFMLPVVSSLVRDIDLTRFSRSLYLLLRSGVPITTALELASQVVVRRQTSQLFAKAKEMVYSGKRFSEGIRQNKGIVPNIMIKLIEAGEKSGTLETSMADVANYLDYQVTNRLKAVTAIIEPALLIAVGLSVGGMMLAIIAPIYGLVGQIGGR
ncbi:MAG: type II secretion system F family protein [bacterium]|nr:type II secretion system F family protein [bacterium]